jgi:hypothetical protein
MLESWKFSEADSRSANGPNKSYRCYFTDADDRIQSYQQISCENDAQAALKARMLLDSSQFAAAELWQGRRIVGKWGKGDAAQPVRETDAERKQVTGPGA